MGASRSKLLPETSKFTTAEQNDRIKYAASSMQGWCPTMEDTRAAILDLDGSNSTSFFGVYDGHGGSNVASYCASRFHFELTHDDAYRNDLADALKHVFFRIDEQLKELEDLRTSLPPSSNICLTRSDEATAGATVRSYPVKAASCNEGSTACVALITGNQIIVGNVGNSRCVLSRGGQAIDLSIDHIPNEVLECDRISIAGGQVYNDLIPRRRILGAVVSRKFGRPRINGISALSRAIGDFTFKNNTSLPPEGQMVTCDPDIHTEDITSDTEFLLIASDGVWDVAESQNVVDFVHKHLKSGETDLRIICERLLDNCLVSRDNITVILVQFKHAPVTPPAPLTGCEIAQEADEDIGCEISVVGDVPSSRCRAEVGDNDTVNTAGRVGDDLPSLAEF